MQGLHKPKHYKSLHKIPTYLRASFLSAALFITGCMPNPVTYRPNNVPQNDDHTHQRQNDVPTPPPVDDVPRFNLTQFNQVQPEMNSTRYMTENEKSITETFFGDDFNTARIRMTMRPFRKVGLYGTALGDTQISFYKPNHHCADYVVNDNHRNFGLFMHEVTHLWQSQTRRRFTNTNTVPRRLYSYTLRDDRRFSDYGIEQQASMIGDYCRLFLHAAAEPSGIIRNKDLLRDMVEDIFPGAKTLRKYFEIHGALPTPAFARWQSAQSILNVPSP